MSMQCVRAWGKTCVEQFDQEASGMRQQYDNKSFMDPRKYRKFYQVHLKL